VRPDHGRRAGILIHDMVSGIKFRGSQRIVTGGLLVGKSANRVNLEIVELSGKQTPDTPMSRDKPRERHYAAWTNEDDA